MGKRFKPVAAHVWLLAFSLVFCFSHGFIQGLVIVLDVCLNFCASKAISKFQKKKAFLILGISVNVIALLVLKYMGLFSEIAGLLLSKEIRIENLIMPVGISYLTFRQIGYLVDVYRNELNIPEAVDYFLYAFYFPMLVQGPITPANDFFAKLGEDGHTKYNPERFSKGLYWAVIGLTKKILLADTLAKTVSWCFDNTEILTSAEIIILMFVFTTQLYFDFSGYCDIAAGVSEMFGITLPKNFDSPYKSKSVTEIWRRWHITLSDFLKKYIYFPLGGSKKGSIRTYINIIIVYVISGLWHGAGFTYVAWGIINGILQTIERLLKKPITKMNKYVCWFFTYLMWNVTCLLFRSTSLSQFWLLFTGVFTRKSFNLSGEFLTSATIFELEYLEKHMGNLGQYLSMLHLPGFMLVSLIIIFGFKNLYEKDFKPSMFKAVAAGVLLLWCILSLGGITSFLYVIY